MTRYARLWTVTGTALLALTTTLVGQAREARSAGAAPDASKGLTAVQGVKVGQFTRTERPTGCTVILTEAGAVGGVERCATALKTMSGW